MSVLNNARMYVGTQKVLSVYLGDKLLTVPDIEAIFGSHPGRMGTFYGFSWDEILATNARAVAAGRPQDCVAFEDSVGTVPLLAPLGVGKGCGLLLDREYGLVRGPELVTNGGFDSAAGWSAQTGWSIAGGVAVATNTPAGSLLFQSGTLIPDAWYEVSVKAVVTASSVSVRLYGVNQFNITASGTYLVKVQAGPAGTIAISPSTGFTGSVDDFSVRRLPGNHAVQPTAAARGEMSRRVNLFDYSEDLSNSAWAKSGLSVVGTLATEASSSARLMRATGTPVAAGVPMSVVVKLSRGNADWVQVLVSDVSTFNANFARIWLNVATGGIGPTGVFGTGVEFTGAQLLDTTGPVRIFRLTFLYAAAGAAFLGVWTASASGITSRADVGSGAGIGSTFNLHGGDIRFTTDAIPSLPPYQRVTSAADYEEAGFPAYLRRQTDDWMRAPVNPNGATKVAAFWGGQRFSSSASLIVFETSLNSTNVQSTIALITSDTQRYAWRSRGASGSQANALGGAVPQPSRLLFRGYASIAEDVCSMHINGQASATSSTDQGTGAYSEQILFIGARGGTALFDSHREYSPPLLIFMQPADPGLSASQIARIEREMNKSIKAY